MKYFDDKCPTTAYVWYRLLGEKRKLISDHPSHACFATMFDGSIPANCEKVEYYHERARVPYDNDAINRWVKMANDLRFPCSVEIGDKEVVFTVLTKDYTSKLHFLSTLMILRLMTETGLVKLPERYFQDEDEHPNGDRFKMLQKCHTTTKEQDWVNNYHMVTYKGHAHITHEELFENFEASKMPINHYGRGPKGYQAVNGAWWDQYVVRKKEPESEAKPAKKANREEEVAF